MALNLYPTRRWSSSSSCACACMCVCVFCSSAQREIKLWSVCIHFFLFTSCSFRPAFKITLCSLPQTCILCLLANSLFPHVPPAGTYPGARLSNACSTTSTSYIPVLKEDRGVSKRYPLSLWWCHYRSLVRLLDLKWRLRLWLSLSIVGAHILFSQPLVNLLSLECPACMALGKYVLSRNVGVARYSCAIALGLFVIYILPFSGSGSATYEIKK